MVGGVVCVCRGTPTPHCALWAAADGRRTHPALGDPVPWDAAIDPSARCLHANSPGASAPPAPPAAAVTPHRDPNAALWICWGWGPPAPVLPPQRSARGCGCPAFVTGRAPRDAPSALQGVPTAMGQRCGTAGGCHPSHPPKRRGRESRAARPEDLYAFN